jgi:hypothetical protein
MPPRNTSGTNTTIGVSVEPTSAGVSSRMAASAALCGLSPAERWTTMFSTITMASSMTTPMQAARPPRVMRLKLMFPSFMKTMATSAAMGITTAATTVLRQLRRNRVRMAMERPRPMRMLSTTPWIESRTRMDWS